MRAASSIVLRLASLALFATTARRSGRRRSPSGRPPPSQGQTAYGAIAVPAGSDSSLSIPVAVIRGARPGPVVAFVAGSHGTEYTSIIAMQKLIGRIAPTQLAGTVIVAPLLNVYSFQMMTPHINPIDRKGMNASYPGDASGTQTQRALAAVTEQIVAPADVIVDLHGGDLDEDLRPYSYWFRGGRAAQDSAGLRLALAFGLDHIIVTDVDPSSPTAGRSLSGQALVRGKTVLVAEAGRSGVVSNADLASLVDGSLNVLGALHMIERRCSTDEACHLARGRGRSRRRGQRRRFLSRCSARHSRDEGTGRRPDDRLPRPPDRRDPRADRRTRHVHPWRPVDGPAGDARQRRSGATRFRELESTSLEVAPSAQAYCVRRANAHARARGNHRLRRSCSE